MTHWEKQHFVFTLAIAMVAGIIFAQLFLQ